MFYLINNQILPISYGLNILEYLPRENKFLPWKYAVEHVKKILSYVEDDSQIYSKLRVNKYFLKFLNCQNFLNLSLKEYIIDLIKPIYVKLQWGENIMDTLDEKYEKNSKFSN